MMQSHILRGAVQGGQLFARLLNADGPEPMDTQPMLTKVKSTAHNPPHRTLSTFESKRMKVMGDDTDSFVKNVSLHQLITFNLVIRFFKFHKFLFWLL